jgi:hypothetical protein
VSRRFTTEGDPELNLKNLIRIFFLLTIAVITAAILRSMI